MCKWAACSCCCSSLALDCSLESRKLLPLALSIRTSLRVCSTAHCLYNICRVPGLCEGGMHTTQHACLVFCSIERKVIGGQRVHGAMAPCCTPCGHVCVGGWVGGSSVLIIACSFRRRPLQTLPQRPALSLLTDDMPCQLQLSFVFAFTCLLYRESYSYLRRVLDTMKSGGHWGRSAPRPYHPHAPSPSSTHTTQPPTQHCSTTRPRVDMPVLCVCAGAAVVCCAACVLVVASSASAIERRCCA